MADKQGTVLNLTRSLHPFFAHTRAMMAIKQKKDVGTGLDSRPCLVSIIFADLPSLHTLHFIEMIFILVYIACLFYSNKPSNHLATGS